MSEVIIPILVGYLILRELFFVYTTKQLLDRLMSRNYQDYNFSKTAYTFKGQEKPAMTPDDPDDLGSLAEFTQ